MIYKKGVPKYWFDEILPAYNYYRKTDFKTPKEMIIFEYAKLQSAAKVGDALGVDKRAVVNLLTYYNIPRVPGGGYRPSNCLIKILEIPVVKLKTMTSKEISKITGIQQRNISNLMNEAGLDYKKRGSRWGRTIADKLAEIPKNEIANMTAIQIAGRIGCKNRSVRKVLNRENIKYQVGMAGRKTREALL